MLCVNSEVPSREFALAYVPEALKFLQRGCCETEDLTEVAADCPATEVSAFIGGLTAVSPAPLGVCARLHGDAAHEASQNYVGRKYFSAFILMVKGVVCNNSCLGGYFME